MFIIKRHLVDFNVDLEFDGEQVKVKDGEKVIDRVRVQGFRNGAVKMRELEEEMHLACQAMC